MRVGLRGRRSCLLWALTFLCVIGISASALTVAFGSPISTVLRATSFTTQAAVAAQVVRSFREGERAALLTLDDRVLAQLPVFAQGEALDDVIQRVRKLRADGYYQQMQIDFFEVTQVSQDDPYLYVTTNEQVSTATYLQTSGDAITLERKTGTFKATYQLAHVDDRWKVTQTIVAPK